MKTFPLILGNNWDEPIGQIALSDDLVARIEKELPNLTLSYSWVRDEENKNRLQMVALMFDPKVQGDPDGN